MCSWGVSFLYVRYFALMVDQYHMYGCMWIFATFCFAKSLFSILYLPETKGKSFDEIKMMLEGSSSYSSEIEMDKIGQKIANNK